jgi:hypothetical protein
MYTGKAEVLKAILLFVDLSHNKTVCTTYQKSKNCQNKVSHQHTF